MNYPVSGEGGKDTLEVKHRHTGALLYVHPASSLKAAVLTGLQLVGADLRHLDLREISLTDVDLTDADLRGANLSSAHLADVILDRAQLSGARLAGAHLVSGRLEKADFTGADLRGFRVVGASFAGAVLEDADLRNASFNTVILSWTVLRGARLDRCRLRSVYLNSAELNGAILKGARYNRATTWPEGFVPEEHGARPFLREPPLPRRPRITLAQRAKIQRVIEGLRSAFPEAVPVTEDEKTRQELRTMRTDVVRLTPFYLAQYLPAILEDLLVQYLGGGEDWQGSDHWMVLTLLNVEREYPETYYLEKAESLGEEIAAHSRQSDAEARTYQSAQFVDFTPSQASAILEWLQLAGTLKGLAEDSARRDLDGALLYWRRRCAPSAWEESSNSLKK